MKTAATAAVAILAVALAACQNDLDRRYLDATTGENLVLPPDLARFEVESTFELPPGFSGDDPNERNQVPVLAKVEDVRLEGSGDLYWLEVDQPVSETYRRVKSFWATEGFRLLVDEPVIGIMQTEWVIKEEGAAKEGGSWFQRLFAGDDLSATQDQFKTRIERIPGGGSRVYIAHRGTEYVHTVVSGDRFSAGDTEENRWRFRQPEPALEIEMLSRLMIHLGLEQSEAERQTARARLFTPRSVFLLDDDENSPFLMLRDPYQIGWNRVYHELERLNFPIVDAEFKSGLLQKGFITFESRVIEEKKRGGFFGIGSKSESVAKKFTLVLSEETHETTRVEIENEAGELDTTPEGAELLTLLHQQLR